MDKNIIKNYLKSFVSEAVSPTPATTPAIKLAKKIAGENKKENDKALKDVAKNMTDYEKALKTNDPNQKQMAQNKINYNTDDEKNYHDQMEIMNGQEMIQYDREPNEMFKERAMKAIEGHPTMGNSPEWANVVAKGQGGDPEFGKNLVKKIKASEKKRSEQTPTSEMFGDDWEVVKDKSHKSYAFESVEDKTKCPVCDKSKSDCKCTDKDKATHAMKGLDTDYEKDSRAQQYGMNPYDMDEKTNKNKPQIKESMKRLRFKKEFNGVGNALKLIPESYKVDNKIFEMTDGNENYRIRWEGSINEGSAVILMASDKKLVNEDMQKMKRLMGYKSEETIGTLKGSERINENKAFSEIWDKTKKLMNEVEENEGDDAENGDWDDAITSQAPDAKKHVQGSASGEKGTQASAKTGHLDKAITKQAAEAKAHMNEDSKKKSLAEDYEQEDELSNRLDAMKNREDDEEAPVIKRKDAYDASLDIADPEDLEKNITKTDIEKQERPVKFVGADVEDDEDELDIPKTQPSTNYKLMKNSKGDYAVIMVNNGNKQLVTMVPEKYVDLARRDIDAALDLMSKESEMSDDELMEHLNEMISEAKTEESEIKKGKFTTWCKNNGFEGPSIACSKKAMASDSTSAHKMATFYMNTVKPKGKTTKDI